MTRSFRFSNKTFSLFILILLFNLNFLIVKSDIISSMETVNILSIEYPLLFNESNAYDHISSQLDFGFRVPGTLEHDMCADWIK